MARIYADKSDIKPLKKEDDAQVKRYVRNTEGNSSKKSAESQKQDKSINKNSPKAKEAPKVQHVQAKQNVEKEQATKKEMDKKDSANSSPSNKHKISHSENKKEEKRPIKKQEIPQKQMPSSSSEVPKAEFDDEETTFMGNEETSQKYPFLENAATGERYYVYSVPFTIGKRTTCDLSIDSKIVSREHAQIVSDGQKYFVIDMESKNGTYINGYRIIPMNEIEIKNGQTIIFANEKYIFKKE